MIAINIPDRKEFTKALFIGNVFDRFLLSEASITTFCNFSIDGALHRNFYSTEEQGSMRLEERAFSLWKECKPFCFSVIKGTHTPLHFRFVFQLSRRDMEQFLISCGIPMSVDDVFGLFLNITFDGTSLTCTTGTSMRMFTLDKTLDNSWDNWIMSFFKQHGLAAEKIS